MTTERLKELAPSLEHWECEYSEREVDNQTECLRKAIEMLDDIYEARGELDKLNCKIMRIKSLLLEIGE